MNQLQIEKAQDKKSFIIQYIDKEAFKIFTLMDETKDRDSLINYEKYGVKEKQEIKRLEEQVEQLEKIIE